MLRKRSIARLVALTIIVSLAALPSAAAPTATSPPLNTADSFVVLAGTAITDIPTSAITGDVGLSPGAGSNYAGLTAAEVTGTIYAVDASGPAGSVVNPALLTTAKTDLVAAYGALAGQGCDTTYGGVQDLVGLTLVPGVYCADAFELSGTLTLNGANTDVWVFKSASTLITSGTANVVLSTGGVPCDVWWQVGSSATLGTNTSLAGNILALTSISLATGANLDGRALAQNAAVTMDSNTITLPICALAVPVITTEIHDNDHVEVIFAQIDTVVHDMATVAGTQGITPTGTVTFTVYANPTCAAPGTFAGAVPLNGLGVADPSYTATLTSAGLSYLAHYSGDATYDPADGPCEVLVAPGMPRITTAIHDANNAEVFAAPVGTMVHDTATVTGTLGTPTGTVTFTVYANQACSAPGTFAGAVQLDGLGVADPSYTATLTSAGLSYLAHYSGDATYDPADGPCEVLRALPTAVELLYFQANPLSGQQVQLKWATALEVDNFGFNLYRANVNDVAVARAGGPVHFEPAVTQGSGSGATYAYVDTVPTAGPWWYWLSDVDTHGLETFHGTPINTTVQSGLSLPFHVYMPLAAIGSGH